MERESAVEVCLPSAFAPSTGPSHATSASISAALTNAAAAAVPRLLTLTQSNRRQSSPPDDHFVSELDFSHLLSSFCSPISSDASDVSGCTVPEQVCCTATSEQPCMPSCTPPLTPIMTPGDHQHGHSTGNTYFLHQPSAAHAIMPSSASPQASTAGRQAQYQSSNSHPHSGGLYAPTGALGGNVDAAAAAFYASTNANMMAGIPNTAALTTGIAPRERLFRQDVGGEERKVFGGDFPSASTWNQGLSEMPSTLEQQQQHRRMSQTNQINVPGLYGQAPNCICRSLGQTTCTCGNSQSGFASTASHGPKYEEQQQIWHTPAARHPSVSQIDQTVEQPQRQSLLSANSAPETSFGYVSNPSSTSVLPFANAGQLSSQNVSAQYPHSSHLYTSFPTGASSTTASVSRHSSATPTTAASAWPSNATNYSATSSSSWSASNAAAPRASDHGVDLSGPYFHSSTVGESAVTPTYAPAMTTSSSSDGGSQAHGVAPYIDRRPSVGQQHRFYVAVPAASATFGRAQQWDGMTRPYDASLSLDLNDVTSEQSIQYAAEEKRWDAITRRSHSADSHFVYGALTTRIYCRPSCASKRPDRGRVQYFMFPNAAAKAEAAGFRACKRCKPGTPGTADVCVLAVGECLRHMTRAALLGESDEVDKRLKRRTLKQYSCDYGVSAFHFHRTLKSVSTLTPGEYSKAAHSLVLQDELGMDRHGRALGNEELNRKLRGWSARRARRALGNVLPHVYANGMGDLQARYVCANTPFGTTVLLYAAILPDAMTAAYTGQQAPGASGVPLPYGELPSTASTGGISVIAVLLGDDAVQRVTVRAPHATRDDSRAEWLTQLVAMLAAKGTREVQMPREVVYWVRRARIYLAAKNALESPSNEASQSPRQARGGADLADDAFDEEGGFE